MIETTEQPRRGRPPRAETAMTEGRRERRRTAGAPETMGLKLEIPTWVKDKYPERQFVYRWFVNAPGRAEWAHANDWDRVEGADEVHATDKDGRPAPHVLHVKHRDWYETDRRPREDARDELQKQMERGNVTEKGDGAGETLSQRHQYAEATSSNRLS